MLTAANCVDPRDTHTTSDLPMQSSSQDAVDESQGTQEDSSSLEVDSSDTLSLESDKLQTDNAPLAVPEMWNPDFSHVQA